ncbi:MAG: tetratricopeptide repeat-containing protein [Actinomycetota bacterium]|nr:tetratricopeptide repeat-containing protein [Actinomycetota bacterium]
MLERAVGAFPPGTTNVKYAFALYNLGRALRLSGRADEAVAVLERRLQIPNQRATVQKELDQARAAAG